MPPADQLDKPVFQRRSAPHRVDRTSRQHPACRDDSDVITHALHQIHGVAGDDDRATRGDVALQDVADVRRRDRINRLEWLVEHEESWRVHEGTGESDLLGHTRRVVHHQRAAGTLQVEQAKQVVDALGDRSPVHAREQP